MIEINSLVCDQFKYKYIQEFEKAYNVSVIRKDIHAFIFDYITESPDINIPCKYNIICKNGKEMQLIDIHYRSKFIRSVLYIVDRFKFKSSNTVIGGIFFCRFIHSTEIPRTEETMINFIDYFMESYQINLIRNHYYIFCDIINDVIILFYNDKYKVLNTAFNIN